MKIPDKKMLRIDLDMPPQPALHTTRSKAASNAVPVSNSRDLPIPNSPGANNNNQHPLAQAAAQSNPSIQEPGNQDSMSSLALAEQHRNGRQTSRPRQRPPTSLISARGVSESRKQSGTIQELAYTLGTLGPNATTENFTLGAGYQTLGPMGNNGLGMGTSYQNSFNNLFTQDSNDGFPSPFTFRRSTAIDRLHQRFNPNLYTQMPQISSAIEYQSNVTGVEQQINTSRIENYSGVSSIHHKPELISVNQNPTIKIPISPKITSNENPLKMLQRTQTDMTDTPKVVQEAERNLFSRLPGENGINATLEKREASELQREASKIEPSKPATQKLSTLPTARRPGLKPSKTFAEFTANMLGETKKEHTSIAAPSVTASSSAANKSTGTGSAPNGRPAAQSGTLDTPSHSITNTANTNTGTGIGTPPKSNAQMTKTMSNPSILPPQRARPSYAKGPRFGFERQQSNMSSNGPVNSGNNSNHNSGNGNSPNKSKISATLPLASSRTIHTARATGRVERKQSTVPGIREPSLANTNGYVKNSALKDYQKRIKDFAILNHSDDDEDAIPGKGRAMAAEGDQDEEQEQEEEAQDPEKRERIIKWLRGVEDAEDPNTSPLPGSFSATVHRFIGGNVLGGGSNTGNEDKEESIHYLYDAIPDSPDSQMHRDTAIHIVYEGAEKS